MTIEVKHVQQPSAVSCVHACLSMVTGIPVSELIDRFGNHGLGLDVEATVLTEMGIYPTKISTGIESQIGVGVYFMDVPSLNLTGKMHLCVMVYDGHEMIIYDPNEGREGVKSYHPKGLHSGNSPSPSNFSFTRLESLDRHHGTDIRRVLYKKREDVLSIDGAVRPKNPWPRNTGEK